MDKERAFPHQCNALGLGYGMTLRDYFAAKAMEGYIAKHKVQSSTLQIARLAYRFADAMLEARDEDHD